MLVARRCFETTTVVLFWILSALTGCHRAPTTVSGIVTLDGKPLSVGSDARGTVIFQPAGGQGATSTGLLEPSGNFNLGTGGSKEVAVGKYDVAVSVVQLLPKPERAEQSAKRVTPAKYADASASGFAAEVGPGENHFSFNLVSDANRESASAASETSPSAAEGAKSQAKSTGNN
jgi:hypothetical protein